MKTRGLLIRVGVDTSAKGGNWNAPCFKDGRFCYVPIPAGESSSRGSSFDHTYAEFKPFVTAMDVEWPDNLSGLCHLDPDFSHLSYGDSTKRALRIRRVLHPGDFIVFWSGLRLHGTGNDRLICSIIGFFRVAYTINAHQVGLLDSHRNAHTRYETSMSTPDVVVFGSPSESGRLKKHIPIGESMPARGWKSPQQCVYPEYVRAWGGLKNESGSDLKHGYIQKSINPPLFANGDKFLRWFMRKRPKLVHANNV